MKAVLGLLFGLLVSPPLFAASLSLTTLPRFEGIFGEEGVLAQRSVLSVQVSGQAEPFSFYLDAFGEFEGDETRRQERRLENPVFLQEAYVEFKMNSFYLKAGKQALRWSEMWLLPSLDLWTGRKWNRLMYGTQAEQFEHSGGVSVSWASQIFSVDAVLLSEVARSRLPRPLPEYLEERNQIDTNGGVRARLDLAGFGFSVVNGRANNVDTKGLGLNYAFDQAVPKLEIGRRESQERLAPDTNTDFVTAGIDFFFSEWTFQPQATFTQTRGPGREDVEESLFYLGMTWARDRHLFEAQSFLNSQSEEFYLNVGYSYKTRDWLQLGGFVQSYAGAKGTLFGTYRDLTGGQVVGLRLEMNTGWSTP